MNDNYQTYDAIQLAADDAFIRWVRFGAASDEAAWQSWLDRYPEKLPVVADARRLVNHLTFNPSQPTIDKDRLWSRIQASNRKPAAIQPIANRRRMLFGIVGAAAAALALVLFIIFGLDRPQQIETAMTEHREQILPDESKVQLNADSRISYDDTGRRIELTGEAFFAVTKKGTDFIVKTDLGQVRVLGTQFNVFSRDHRFRVQCTEGRVQVTTPGDPQGIILTPGMACTLTTAGKLETETLPGPEAGIGWLDDTYRFKAQPLSDIFQEMERQFGLKIEADNAIMARIHTGSFFGGDPEQALKDICWPQKLTFTIEGKQVRITEDDTE